MNRRQFLVLPMMGLLKTTYEPFVVSSIQTRFTYIQWDYGNKIKFFYWPQDSKIISIQQFVEAIDKAGDPRYTNKPSILTVRRVANPIYPDRGFVFWFDELDEDNRMW